MTPRSSTKVLSRFTYGTMHLCRVNKLHAVVFFEVRCTAWRGRTSSVGQVVEEPARRRQVVEHSVSRVVKEPSCRRGDLLDITWSRQQH